ncbi:MAG: hypothetical protein L6W00_08685 [Lentisphaeria bacterium]|nr:MAG: hypothetical protein L6W00_08685 [Lentisphaeria bacterium]
MPDRGKVTGKRLISCMLSIAGLLGILLLSGCRSTPPEPPPPAAQWFDTGTFRVEVVDASLPRDVRSTGCRFLLAGWVRSLIPQGAETSILRTRSIHHRLPAYGCPFEFYPYPRTGSRRAARALLPAPDRRRRRPGARRGAV